MATFQAGGSREGLKSPYDHPTTSRKSKPSPQYVLSAMALKPENWRLNRNHKARLGFASADCMPLLIVCLRFLQKSRIIFLSIFFESMTPEKEHQPRKKKIYWPNVGIIARWSSLSERARKRQGKQLKGNREKWVTILNVETEISANPHRNPIKADWNEQATFCQAMFFVEREDWI
jgi:hypothetical protein